MDHNAEAFKRINEKKEEMANLLFYLYAHQNNLDVRYKLEGDTKWRVPKKPK